VSIVLLGFTIWLDGRLAHRTERGRAAGRQQQLVLAASAIGAQQRGS